MWTIHPPKLDSLLPGDFKLTLNDAGTMSAWTIFRSPVAGWPEVQAAIVAELKAVASQTAKESKHAARLAELQKQQDTLQARITSIDRKLSALAGRRGDPSLLDVADLAGEVQRMDAEENALRQQRAATEKAIGVLSPHQQRAQDALSGEVQNAAKDALERLRAAANERRMALFAELANAAGPVLDKLIQAQTEAGALMNDALLQQLGLPAGKVQLVGLAGPM